MTIAELLFIALFLGSSIVLIGAVIQLLRGKRRSTVHLLTTLTTIWITYFVVLVLVAAFSQQRVLKMNEDLCFDEMCFAAVGAQVSTQLGTPGHAVKPVGDFLVVTIRVSSHSRGRTQREAALWPLLWNGNRFYQPSAEGQRAYAAEHGESPSLTSPLAPGQSLLSVQVYDVLRPSPPLALVLDHGFTPGYFVIGESPILHKPTRIQLDPVQVIVDP
jgi:hypothetical protein